MKDTRQRILDTALTLFSQNGFSAVSIRDICAQVQIKESTVYYHFTNKQAIFDELLQQFQTAAARLMSLLEQSFPAASLPAEGNFLGKTCDFFFEQYLMDDFCNKMLRLLSIEQFRSDEMRETHHRWMFDVPLRFQSSLFSQLSEAGILRHPDSDYLAVKFYAPIFLFAQRWLLCGALSEDSKQSFRADAYRHMQQFFEELRG